MSIEQIRKAYHTDLKIGEWVRVREHAEPPHLVGKTGKIVSAVGGKYLRIRASTWTALFYPFEVIRASEQEQP